MLSCLDLLFVLFGLLAQIVSFMYNGKVAKELEANVLRKKRFSTVKLARVSDMNSAFNPSALLPIAYIPSAKPTHVFCR